MEPKLVAAGEGAAPAYRKLVGLSSDVTNADLPAGFERVVEQATGNIKYAGPNGQIYDTIEQIPGMKAVTAAADALKPDVTLKLDSATQALAEANLTNSGQTVLGPYPGYINKADAKGASFFDIGDAWTSLSDPQRWAANSHFLDVIAERGDQVLLAVTKDSIRPGSYLEQEITYLTAQNGYVWQNQWSMVPKGK